MPRHFEDSRVWSVFLLLSLTVCPSPVRARQDPEQGQQDDGDGQARFYKGRRIADVMSFHGADWLLRPSRVREEQPEKMLDALEIKPGMTVADVGAGVGFTSLKIAQRVGKKGKVLATDLQPEMIAMLKQRMRAAKVTNVEPVLCTPDDPKLPEGKVDLALMVDVYHECSDPEAVLRGLRRALKPGGRLVLVEFRGEDPEVPIKPEHKMTVAQVRKELEPQGFVFKKLHTFLPWQHILVFERPADEEARDKAAEGGATTPRDAKE